MTLHLACIAALFAQAAEPPGPWLGAVTGVGDIDGDGLDDLLVGDPAAAGDRGGAWLYRSDAQPADTVAPQWLAAPSDVVGFGVSAAPLGDVDGDGFDDVVVGADGHGATAGAVVVWRGAASGLVDPVVLRPGRGAPTDAFGRSVAAAGDVDGDGHGDLVVGAPGAPGDLAGAVWLFLGDETGFVPDGTALQPGTADLDQLGLHVAGVGDLDGDGLADLAASTRRAGIVVWHGAAGGTPTAPLVLDGPAATAPTGPVAAAGDVDGDGFSDLVQGMPETASSRIRFGSGSGLDGRERLLQSGGAAASDGLDQFGAAVTGAGDVDGDGLADVAVGRTHGPGPRDGGAVDLFSGAGAAVAGYPQPPDATLTPCAAVQAGRFGRSVRPAGDIDGDGLHDLVVGAMVGAPAYVFRGTVDPWQDRCADGLLPPPPSSADTGDTGASVDGGDDAREGGAGCGCTHTTGAAVDVSWLMPLMRLTSRR